MNKTAVNKSVTNHEKKFPKGELKISPVSKADSDIVKELREIFKKLDQREVVAILDEWKYKSDKDIEESLLEFNTYFKEKQLDKDLDEENVFEEEIVKMKRRMITILGASMTLSEVHSIEVEDDYSDYLPVYKIVLNKEDENASKQSIYANRTFKFDCKEERDQIIEDVKTDMEISGNIIFINNK